MSASDTDDRFHNLLDRWEELREQGQDPDVEELCRECPHLAERLRDWVRVLKMSDWMCQRADEVADETFGETGVLTAEEKDRHRTLGEYTLLEELGGGGMGRVFKAVHRKMDRTVAVKLLPESLVRSPESVERFRREIQALARLSHPNIVAVHDAGSADGTYFYVMDLIDGRDLARVVKEDGSLSIQRAVDYALQAARGLEYAHAQGVVHRDIKPSNLILDRDGTLKILDLGIARFQPVPEQAGDDLTRTGCVLGTVDYMAPEQAMNTRRADHRADIYSLGCTLYFLLTGQPLYGGDTVMERLVGHREHSVPSLRKACPAAPPWLDAVFRKMVAKKPEDRYQTVTEVISALERHVAPPRKRRSRVVAALTALLVIAGFLVFFHGMTSHKETDLDNKLTDGKRLCFVENKWAEGLPVLAQCGDPQLRKLAMLDLKENASHQERLRLGDRWWDFAGNEVESAWKSSQQRAANWYREAIPFPHQRKAEIEKRLKDLDEQPPGFEVLARQARVFPNETHGSARSTNLLLEVSKNETTSPGAGYAGLRLTGVRFLNVAVNASANIDKKARNSFAGFMVDYHAASGYAKRVALGIGAFDKDRGDHSPYWGKNAVPDEYVDLGRHDLYELDLQQWAPPGWDGQLWFTLALQRAGLNTALAAQLMPLAKQQEKKKPLELAVKPSWRTTGEYPLIAGVWSIVQNKGTLVTITQHGSDFVATASYKSGEETVSWRAEGRISKSGHITMRLVHTHSHPPDKWLPQTRTAVLGLHGKSLEGYVAFEGGGHKFTWRLVEPRAADEKESSR
jgi:serine/threonine protein kinase